jgi:2,3-diketo-5-methylthio-1-phosphopentane phosphatase
MMQSMLVIIDFDDTAAVQNVARLLLDRFGDSACSEIQARYTAGKLKFRDYQEMAFRSLPVDVARLREYAAEAATLRPGFRETVEAARKAGADVAIVSAGLDLYIDPVLQRNGFPDLPVRSVRTGAFDGPAASLTFSYPATRPGCPEEYGVCKCRAFAAALDTRTEVVFVGDGRLADTCAAARATTVFARSRLLEHCRANAIPARPFDDLFPLAAHIASAARLGANGARPA